MKTDLSYKLFAAIFMQRVISRILYSRRDRSPQEIIEDLDVLVSAMSNVMVQLDDDEKFFFEKLLRNWSLS